MQKLSATHTNVTTIQFTMTAAWARVPYVSFNVFDIGVHSKSWVRNAYFLASVWFSYVCEGKSRKKRTKRKEKQQTSKKHTKPTRKHRKIQRLSSY